MKSKLTANKPFLLMLYGYPGSGKTFFARQFAEEFNSAVHLDVDKINHELGDELHTINQHDHRVPEIIIKYMAKEFLNSGSSIIFDVSATKKSERKRIAKMALEHKATPILVWLQIDADSAFMRARKRDRRKAEDKYAAEYSSSEFQSIISSSQNPLNEDYVVISGKHTFKTQRGFVMKKMYDLGVLTPGQVSGKIVKPELINLVPNLSGRSSVLGKRNISIR